MNFLRKSSLHTFKEEMQSLTELSVPLGQIKISYDDNVMVLTNIIQGLQIDILFEIRISHS